MKPQDKRTGTVQPIIVCIPKDTKGKSDSKDVNKPSQSAAATRYTSGQEYRTKLLGDVAGAGSHLINDRIISQPEKQGHRPVSIPKAPARLLGEGRGLSPSRFLGQHHGGTSGNVEIQRTPLLYVTSSARRSAS